MENAKGREIYDKITSRIRKKVPPILGASLSRLTGEAHKAVKDFCDHFSWDPSLSGMDDSHRFRQEHSKRFHSDVATGTATQGLKYAAFRGRLGEENHRGMGEAPANRGQQ